MRRLLCRIFGHRWEARWSPEWRSPTFAYLTCGRCNSEGWETR